ncbi:MAG: PTS sugar transporter subunit IIA [Inhella sp.]
MSSHDEVRVVLIAHAPLAGAMGEVARHAFPECASGIDCVDVLPDSTLDEIKLRLLALLDARPTLVLADVLGATPANAIQQVLAERAGLRAVAGLNVPMLWRVLCYRWEDLDVLAERAMTGGQRGIITMNNSG